MRLDPCHREANDLLAQRTLRNKHLELAGAAK